MALQVLNGPFIQPGESLSDAHDCTAGSIIRLTMPGVWTPANISFQISTDGALFNDLVDFDGDYVQVPIVAGSALVVAPLVDYLKAVAFLKIRSGTPDHPVPQADLREFAVAIEVAGA
ncbi:hypothetical protein [Bradyrhizobium elkanii]|uniref:hypothetical protein n=1 Tax=Bradyrhizobium elkanii TaxID=29448 RepID=UPI00040CF555|nr:hypothetical protein [Bradyrhizobium elkanii]